MSINLSGYSSVGVCHCVKVDIPEYGVLRLSTFHKTINIQESDGFVYQYDPAGVLMSISEGVSELRASSTETAIGLTGIPLQYAITVQAARLKGSRVEIRRVFTDPITDAPLAITGNPVFMFQGVVTNYGFSESVNEFSDQGSLVINLSCSSLVEMLNTKITGRRTNQESMNQFYPSDSSFNRITNLIGRPFDFGAPVTKTAATQVSAPAAVDSNYDASVMGSA
jgi:hypothetical protein